MKLRYLEYFIEVAECGSISKAAEKLYLKQSNLSYYIHVIENWFSVNLFVRTSKGVILTSQGEDVLLWAKDLLQKQEALILKFNGQSAHGNSFPSSIHFYVPSTTTPEKHFQLFRTLTHIYPNTSFEIKEGSIQVMIEKLEATTQSLAFGIFDKYTIEYINKKEDLIFFSMGSRKLVAHVAKDSIFHKNYHSFSVTSISNFPIVLYGSGEGISPINEILLPYCQLEKASIVTNLGVYFSILNAGKQITLTTDDIANGENCVTIPIRENITVPFGIVVKKNELSNFWMKEIICTCFREFKMPIPPELK